jgi:hypothetical protein
MIKSGEKMEELSKALRATRSQELEEICILAKLDVDSNKSHRSLVQEYLLNKEKVIQAYLDSTPPDKELVDIYALSLGDPPPDLVRDVVIKYELERIIPEYHGVMSYITANSPARTLFINFHIPEQTLDILLNFIPANSVKKDPYIPKDSDYIVCRQGMVSDIIKLAQYIKANKVPLATRGLISRPNGARAMVAGGWSDCCDDGSGNLCTPSKAPHLRNMKVTSSLYLMAYFARFLDRGVPKDFLALPSHEMALKLFKLYIHPQNQTPLNELGLLGVNAENCRLHNARNFVVESLAKCPIGEFIPFSSLDRYMHICDNEFLSRHVPGGIWQAFEVPFIQTCLACLSSIGMVDLAWGKVDIDYTIRLEYLGINGLRLTPLGAWILGLADSYESKESADDGCFVVNGDYAIIISGQLYETRHSPYISRYFTLNPGTSTYTIDFAGIVKLLDDGKTIESFVEYLSANCTKPVPDNVLSTLDDWAQKSKHITLQKAVVLTTDDESLLIEIAHMSEIKKDVKIVPYAAIITGDGSKVKKALQKNGKYAKFL